MRSPDVRRAIHDGRTVLYTPYAPDVATSAANVRGRDTLIHAQSLATLVIADDAAAADGRSSTARSAAESLAHGYGRVAVWRGPGEGPGNAALEEQGATPVRSSTDLESALERGAVAHRSPAEQQRDA